MGLAEMIALIALVVSGLALVLAGVALAYSKAHSRILKRIDTRGRAEFVEKRDARATAVERPDHNYAVDFAPSLAFTAASRCSLSARVIRAEQKPPEGEGNATTAQENPPPQAEKPPPG